MMTDEEVADARRNEGLQRALGQVMDKHEYGRLIQEVYERNEAVEYVKERDEDEESEGVQSEVLQREYDRVEYELDRDEEREQQLLEEKLLKEQQSNTAKKYLQQCKNEKVLPLPILSKIEDGVLALVDYKLNFGLCKALGSVIGDLDSLITKIVLSNNGISDIGYANILQGAFKNDNVKSLHIRNNAFQEESLQQYLRYFR